MVLENVIEFVILNKKFPKSIISVCKELLAEFKMLPKSGDIMSAYEEPIHKAYKILNSLNVAKLLERKEDEIIYFTFDKYLAELSKLYIDAANEFTKTYFSHNDE